MEFDFLIVTSWDKWAVEAKCYWADVLRDRGYTVCFLTPSPTTRGMAEPHCDTAYDLKTLMAETAEVRSPTHFEECYDIPSFPMLFFTEQRMLDFTRDQARGRARSVATVMESLFEEHRFSYCLQAKGSESHRLLAHYLTNHHGGTTIWDGYSPFEGKQALSTSLDMSWDKYETIPYEDISPSERERIEAHIADATDEQAVKTYSADDGSPQPLPLRAVKRVNELRDRDRPVNVRRALTRKARTRLNGSFNKLLLPSVSTSRELARSNRFVFFPLQYPVESRLTVMSPEFYEQEFLIRYLSRILPSHVDLFVKQHPNRPGEQSPGYIRTLQRLDNVRILHPDFNAHEAIQLAEAVTVINNTVGFESLYYQTPLVVVGKAFYDQVPAARSVDRLRELPVALGNEIGGTVDDEPLIESVYSLEQASIPSLYWDIREGRGVESMERPREIVEAVLSLTPQSER